MLYSHPGHPSLKSEHIFRQGTFGWSRSYRGSSFKNHREMNISLGKELLIEADHIEDLVLRTIERFLKKEQEFGSCY